MAARTLYSYNIYGYDVVYTCTLWNNQWKLCRLSAGYDIWQRQWRKWIEESLFFKIIYCCSEESWKNAFEKMLLLLLLVMMISLLQLQGSRYPPGLLLSLSTSVGQCQKMLNFPGCCTDCGGRKLCFWPITYYPGNWPDYIEFILIYLHNND